MLNAYFDRIRFRSEPKVDLPTLAALQRRHLAEIPFEAIDVLAGNTVDLEMPAVVHKLVTHRRGGYCFEQNTLLEHALRTIGFDVTRTLARVLWRQPAHAPRPPRSHLALIVRLHEVDWLVDVGFGGAVPDRPLSLDSVEAQQTNHSWYRLVDGAEGRLLTMWEDGDWKSAYELVPGRVEDADLVIANWYTSTNPHSLFRTALAVSRCTDEARFGLYGRTFSVRFLTGEVIRRELDDIELAQVLRQEFGLPPDLPVFPMPLP